MILMKKLKIKLGIIMIHWIMMVDKELFIDKHVIKIVIMVIHLV